MTYDFSTRLDHVGNRMRGTTNLPTLHPNTLTYSRSGEADLTIVNFTPERIDSSQLALYGIVLVSENDQDIVFDTAEFDSWATKKPLIGDRITWGVIILEPFSIGEEIFTYTTSTRKRIRIHLKQVG